MTKHRISLDRRDFETLVDGNVVTKKVEVASIYYNVEISLQDIGYDVMKEKIQSNITKMTGK